jgi:hypothetical protein
MQFEDLKAWQKARELTNGLAEDAAIQKLQGLAIEVSALTQGLINSFNKRRTPG